MAYSQSPLVGVRIGEVDKPSEVKANRYPLGSVITADDGHDYIYAQASGAIANAAVAILTEPAMTMATGAGAWTNTNVALIATDRAWFKKTAI